MARPDCTSCPSYIVDNDAAKDILGRPFNAPICGRFGHVLGGADLDNEDERNMLQAFAHDCPGYGEPLPARPETIKAQVAEPDTRAIEAGPTGNACASCHGCENLIKAQPVQADLGWLAPLCSVWGSLVFDPRTAKDCMFSRPGMPKADTTAIQLLPRYKAGYRFGQETILEDTLAAGGVTIEPTTYPTDAPVSDEDKADGIRAWRRIPNPDDEEDFAMLPIFDSSENGVFSEDERLMIPQTNGPHHPELYVDYEKLLWVFATDAFEDDETLCLLGPPGLGKTQFGYYLGWLMQVPVRRIMLGPSSDPDDIFGKMLASEGSTYWHNGEFTNAWASHASILIVDEPNTAPEDVIIPLRSTTDNDQQLALHASDKSGSRVVVPKGKYTFQFWCMNESHDERNVGTHDLGIADMSRLSPVALSYPPEPIERDIIIRACKTFSDYDLPSETLDLLMKIAPLFREASRQKEYPGSWGIREQIKVARKTRRHPLVKAYCLAALNFFEPEVRENAIANFIQTFIDES